MSASAALLVALLVAAPDVVTSTVVATKTATPTPAMHQTHTPLSLDDDELPPRTRHVDDDSSLTTAEAPRRDEPLDLPRLLLYAPAWLTELAMAPLAVLAISFEKLRWHERLFDLLTNEHNTFGVFPILDPFNRSGFSAGAAIVHNDPLGSADRLIISGVFRLNRDWSGSASFGRRVPAWNRRIFASASYGLDHDTEYFGIGPDHDRDAQRLMRTESVNAKLGMTLFTSSWQDWEIEAEVAFRHRALGPGIGSGTPLTLNDSLPPPPGFGQSLSYPEATVAWVFDSRDGAGRTTAGLVARVEASVTNDINGGRFGGVRTTGEVTGFLPVLPLNRVLVLTGGVSAATDFGDGGVPFHHLVQLGGGKRLRGYVSRRFVDQFGWWGTIEYRYKVYEYETNGNGFSTALFADFGRVGDTVQALFEAAPAWSVGLGLRAETNLFLLSHAQIAYSPDGVRFSLGFGAL